MPFIFPPFKILLLFERARFFRRLSRHRHLNPPRAPFGTTVFNGKTRNLKGQEEEKRGKEEQFKGQKGFFLPGVFVSSAFQWCELSDFSASLACHHVFSQTPTPKADKAGKQEKKGR